MIIMLNIKDWDQNKPSLASFWGSPIGVLTVAYLLRLYTRSRLYKGITRRIDENARKRNPDIGDEALPTSIIVRQVYADMDVIMRPLVDAIVKGFADILWTIGYHNNGINLLAFSILFILELLTVIFFVYYIIRFHDTSNSLLIVCITVSTLAIVCIPWCRFRPRFFSVFFAVYAGCVSLCLNTVLYLGPSLGSSICVFLVYAAIFLANLGLNLSFNQDLINGPKCAFEHLAWEAIMLSLPELLFIAIPLGIPITLVSARWPYNSNWKLWHILLADNLIVIISAWLYHHLLRIRFVNRHRTLPYKILYRWAIVCGIPFSLLWTYKPIWPRYIPLSITASILYFLGTISFMGYRVLDPLEHEEFCVIAGMCYLALMSLPWLLFWCGEIYTVDTHWRIGIKVTAALLINAAEFGILCATIGLTWRAGIRNRNRNRP